MIHDDTQLRRATPFVPFSKRAVHRPEGGLLQALCDVMGAICISIRLAQGLSIIWLMARNDGDVRNEGRLMELIFSWVEESL
jgi:hypothetical protein